MMPAFTVAAKEFRDHLTSRRFLIIFGILMLLCLLAMATGMGDYNKMLDEYKKSAKQSQQQPWYQERLAELQKQIAEAEANGEPQEKIDMLRNELDMLVNPPMPSVMFVFSALNQLFLIIGWVLALVMGFDLITREREEGSLKSLLSHPVYRDSVINGKALGAIAVLCVVFASVFLLTIAIMLFYGVVPRPEEFLRIAAYFALALLYFLVFFALALMTSAVAKTSSLSVLYVLGVVVALLLMPQFSYRIVEWASGPPPDIGPIMYAESRDIMVNGNAGVSSVSSSAPAADSKEPDGAVVPPDGSILPMPPVDISDDYQKYWERRQMIQDALDTISPMTNFGGKIANTVLSDGNVYLYKSFVEPGGSYGKKMTVWDSLAAIWANVLVLLVEIVIAFAVAYVRFLRVDIR